MPEARTVRAGRIDGICFTSPYAVERITGIGRFVEDLARKLADVGIQPIILSPHHSHRPYTDRSPTIPLAWRSLRNIELSLKTLLQMISLRRRFDVVNAQQAHIQSLAASMAARILGKPCVLTLHLRVPAPQRRLARWAYSVVDRLALAFATTLVAVSPFVAESFGLATIRVIENGVDTDLFRPSETDRRETRLHLGIGNGTVFAFAGRWARAKGFDLLLKAAGSGRLRKRPFHLLIFGERAPDEPNLLESGLSDAPDSQSIRIVGPVDDLPKYLNAGDIFVLPSRFEGMPLAFLEAMASGLPVIASDIPVHRRLADIAGCVRTFQSGDADDLSRAMEEVLESGIPEGWPQRARETVLRHFSLDRMVREYLDLYRELASSPTFA